MFFDPEADAPRPLTHGKFAEMMIEAMERAGVEPGVIYAFRKTGLIFTDALLGELTYEDLCDWQQAPQEFYTLELHRMASQQKGCRITPSILLNLRRRDQPIPRLRNVCLLH